MTVVAERVATRHVCPSCRTVLRAGHRPTRANPRGLCDPCLSAAAVPPSWNPRCDAEFESRWLTHLLAHFREWCHPADVWHSRDELQRLRIRQRASEVAGAAVRLGLLIESDHLRGYRLTGHAGLPRYLHLHERADDGACAELPGQLTLGGETVG